MEEKKFEENVEEEEKIMDEVQESVKEASEEVEEKEEEAPVENKKGEGSFRPILFVMLASFAIAGLWDKVPAIKNAVHFILDPSAGDLLTWNLTIGMLIIVLIITLITTLVQKYATDQKTLKELKKEQKEIQKQMKEFRSHPEKMMELQKKQMAMLPKQMKLSMRGIAYTGVPFILFFRWFNDFFITAGSPKFFGFLSWFWFYLIFAMIFSSILRKQLDVV